MSRISDLIEAESRAAENADDTVDAPLPEGVRVIRGHGRAKVLQVRLNPDEFRMLSKIAAERHLPISTLARAILLDTIGH